jgi:hypothetical protein
MVFIDFSQSEAGYLERSARFNHHALKKKFCFQTTSNFPAIVNGTPQIEKEMFFV